MQNLHIQFACKSITQMYKNSLLYYFASYTGNTCILHYSKIIVFNFTITDSFSPNRKHYWTYMCIEDRYMSYTIYMYMYSGRVMIPSIYFWPCPSLPAKFNCCPDHTCIYTIMYLTGYIHVRCSQFITNINYTSLQPWCSWT